jgi:hypothetical protein
VIAIHAHSLPGRPPEWAAPGGTPRGAPAGGGEPSGTNMAYWQRTRVTGSGTGKSYEESLAAERATSKSPGGIKLPGEVTGAAAAHSRPLPPWLRPAVATAPPSILVGGRRQLSSDNSCSQWWPATIRSATALASQLKLSAIGRVSLQGTGPKRIPGQKSPKSRANTKTLFAGRVISAEVGNPSHCGPLAETPPRFPSAFGLNHWSYTSLLNTSFQ